VRTGAIVAGRYRLVQPLGAGGLGRVWLAHDEAVRRQVAIKMCQLPDGLDPDERDLFLDWTVREARALASIGHPNVVRTYDVLPDAEAPWIVMEYVPSHSLQQVIDESGPLPPARVAAIGLAVLDALLAVRRAGLLHLDVKPSNVLIAHDGRVMLTDFGPAVTGDGLRALAAAGIVLGSPKYLAPERMDGLALPESDLWSLGATLYHAVEGRPPFARRTLDATLQAIAEDPPDPARLAGPLTPVLEGLLRSDPADRLPVGDVGAELSAVVLRDAAEPRGTLDWPSRTRFRFAAVAALIAALLAVVTVLADGRA
jgi:serine/threonine protein kinase